MITNSKNIDKNWNEEDWNTLLYTIRRENCILMLGPDIALQEINGKNIPFSEQLAFKLSEKISPEVKESIDKKNLAQVSQYYSMETGRNDLEAKIQLFFDQRQKLTSIIHKDLAVLPFYLIINTSPDQMYREALKIANKIPIISRYNFKGDNSTIVEMGTTERPLIYHLYGTSDEPESMVLTENDLIDYLVALISNKKPLPDNIISELSSPNKSFLFIGFGFKHWYLRILLHVLQGRKKDSRSFALEKFNLQNEKEMQKTILFFRQSDFKIHIYNDDLQQFVKFLRNRYEQTSNETTKNLTAYSPTIFICHSHEDKDYASNLNQQLHKEGFSPWLDKDNIRGGDEWDWLITKTIKSVDYVVILQSKSLISRYRGYVHKEIKIALDCQDECRRGIRFVIPVLIDECERLDDLDYLQSVNISDPKNIKDLVTTIKRDQNRRMIK